MNNSSSDTVAGLPALRVREFFQRAGFVWDIDFLQDQFHVDEEEAVQIALELLNQGYIDQDRMYSHGERWVITEKAAKLASNSPVNLDP